MKSVSEITACVIDHGLFLPLALKLAKTYKRVLYYTPWEKGFPVIGDCIIGDGFDQIERCNDFWPIKSEIDLFVCPDIQHSGLQLELESQGFAVWGSRNGDSLEINRSKFHRILDELGLEVPEHTEIRGLAALREYLSDKSDKYIKMSKFRGSFESFHWRRS